LHVQVLFRNNFALSRDIAGLFQSFQSSTTVLDPAANPTLFQSRLMIIIKVNLRKGTNGLKTDTHFPRMLWMLTKRILCESKIIESYIAST